ncbi:alpha/beta hydrolase [Bounagaea algeriensis]
MNALDKVKAQLQGIGQAQKWAEAGVQPSSAAAGGLAHAATAMESSSAAATKSMFESSIGNPAAVNAAWSSMSTAQRADLIDRHPQMVGSTNGVPAVARDEANRSILATQRQAIVNKINGLQQAMKEDFRKHGHSDNAKGHVIQPLQEALDGIDQLQEKLGPSAEQSGYYLLGIDSTANDRGQAIVAQGNPDYADNTITLTPGTYSDLQDVTDYVQENENVVERANQMAPGQNNVAITWASYDSPNHIFPHAGQYGYAENTAPDLSEFQEGLRATHESDTPSNNTLVGHSYGSTVVGETSHNTDGSYADSIVFLGSPGVGVDTAHPLDVPADHVWAGKAGNDPIDSTPDSPAHANPTEERAGSHVGRIP